MSGQAILLVVCTANVCRSPAAEILLNRAFQGAGYSGVVRAVSAGVEARPGERMCEQGGSRLGDGTAAHEARRLTVADLQSASIVLALDRSHRSACARLDPGCRPRLFTLRQAALLADGVRASGAWAARPVGRSLRMPTWAAFLLLAALALVVAVTLTPLGGAPDGAVAVPQLPAHPVPVAPASGLWRWPWQWWPVDERTLNVALFVPLGVGVGLVGRRRLRGVLLLVALMLPLVVEGTQYLVGPLNRDADWRDVVDNVTGMVIGLVIGVVLRRATGSSNDGVKSS
jgi:protein-tyrosine-phosphatase/glycopeptide antibiotics resistance protein